MNKIKNQKVIVYSLLFVNVLMFVYFFSLAYFNHFSQDDFAFSHAIKIGGISNFVSDMYKTHSGRFSCYFHEGCLYSLLLKGFPLWSNQLFVMLFCVLIIFFLCCHFFESSFFILNIAIFIINIFFFVNFEFTAFYWSCATGYYIMAVQPLFLFLLVNFTKQNWQTYSLLFILSVWIGGSSEAFVPICLILLVAYWLYLLYEQNFSLRKTLGSVKSKKLIFSCFILLVGFVILFIAPGNKNRMQEFHQTVALIPLLKISLKSVLLYFYLFAFKIPYLLPLFSVFILLGFDYKEKYNLSVNYKCWVIYSLFLFVFFIWLNVLPAAYAVSGFGFQRIYTHTILYSILFFSILSFIIGLKLNPKYKRFLLVFTIIAINGLGVSMIFHIKNDIPTAKKYAESDTKRIEYIIEQKSKNRTEPLYLEPLLYPTTYSFKSLTFSDKKPILYYVNEIDPEIIAGTDVGWGNVCLMQYYDLPFSIYRIKK
jgi:hypothetical protein